jgi:hypothetical protein
VSLSRLVSVAGPLAILFLILGFFASLGHGPLPPLPAGLVVPLHVALGILGALAGVAAGRRQIEIDAQRFEYAQDPHATKGERESAHKEAELQIRSTHMALIGAPLALGYWLANEFAPGAPPWARALSASAILGYGAAVLLGRRRRA